MDSIYSSESGISYCYDNGGVTFYCSDVYTCRDIDMASNVKRVCFGEDNNTNQMYYKLRYSCMIFPNVTEIYIARNVAAIEINNRMFPNCRKIVSNNVNYRSGSMLVKEDKAMDWNFLLNAFCLKKGEDVDLTGIDMIKSGAFSGCEIVEIKNVADLSQVEKYAFSDSDFCSDKNKAVGGFRMAGPIIVEMLPDLEEYEIPDYAIYTAPRAVKAMQKMHKAKRLIINNLAATNTEWKNLWGLECLEISSINLLAQFTHLPKKLILNDPNALKLDETDIFCRHNVNSVAKIQSVLGQDGMEWMELNGSKDYTTKDGILYTKDMRSLLRCPAARAGEVVIPKGVKFINEKAFSHCEWISSVVFPDSLEAIGQQAFAGCHNLKHIEFGNGIKKINCRCFELCWGLEEINLPKQLEIIDYGAFSGCKLCKITFAENGVKYIGDNAFNGKDLGEVTLPESLEYIGAQNFQSVKHIIHLKSVPKRFVIAITGSSFMRSFYEDPMQNMIVLDIDGKQLYMPRTLKLGTEHLVQKILHDKIEDSYGIMFLYANSGRCKLVVAAMSYIAGSRNAKLVKFVKENEKAISNTLLAYGHIKELSEFIQTGFVSHRTLSLMLKALEDGTDTNAALKNNPEASILHDEGKQTTAKAYILKALSEQKNKNNEELHIS
ncbi:MAG: leucine-rich repeat domain-containing protein [Lachnospiraceae bacterium]